MYNDYLKELVRLPRAIVLSDSSGSACENQVVYATCWYRENYEVAPCVGCPHRDEL